MNKISRKEFDKTLAEMTADKNSGTWHCVLEVLENGQELCLVVGWETGYDKGEKFQQEVDGEIYTLCGKIAVNVDDLQCDYNFDWYMPYSEDGDVYDTDMALNGSEDLDFFEGEAKVIAEMMNKGELKVERGSNG